MKNSPAAISILLFIISSILWTLLTIFESALVGMSAGTERILIFLLLVLPAGIGAIFGFLSLIRKEGRAGLAATAMVLNGLFALFHIAIVSFAG